MKTQIIVRIITKKPSDKVYNKFYLKTLETKKWGFCTRSTNNRRITHLYRFEGFKLFEKFIQKNIRIIVKIKIQEIKLSKYN